MHTISLAKLKKLSNPFEEIIEGLNTVIKIDDIKGKLSYKDIFVVTGDSSEETIDQNHLRKIAYHVANSYNSTIYVQLSSINDNNNIIIPTSDNIYKYAAALYRGDKDINIELNSSVRDAKILLGLKLLEDSSIKDIKSDTITPVYWRIVEEKFDNWNDPQKILAYINDDNFSTYYSYIDKELWKNADFLSKIKNKVSSKKIHYEDKLNEAYIHLMCKKDDFFSEFNIFKSEYDLFVDNKSNYPELMQIIQDNVFLSEEFLLKNIKSIDKTIQHYIPQQIKLSEQFISAVYSYQMHHINFQHKIDTYLYDPIVDEYLANEAKTPYWLDNKSNDWKDQFFEKYSKFIVKSLPEYGNIQQKAAYQKIIEHWITDDDEIIKKIQGSSGSIYMQLSKNFPTSVKDKFEYCDAIMSLNGTNYHSLPKQFKGNIDFLHKGLDSLKRSFHTDDSILMTIKDPSILEKLCEHGLYRTLIQLPKFPEEILYNPEYVNKVPLEEAAYYLKYNRKFKAALEQSPERIYELVKSQDIADKLSIKYKHDDKIFLIRLTSHYSYSAKISDYSRFCSQQFCIKALEHSHTLIKHVPQLFWQDRQFVSIVFDLIDKEQISSYIIKNLPEQIKEVLSHYQIEENYKTFFDNHQLHINFEKDNYQDNTVVKKRKI